MLDKPAHETVIIRLLPGISLLMLFAQLDQIVGLFDSKALVQEGIDEQIDKLLHMCNPPLIVQSGELPTLELPKNLLKYPRVKQNRVKLVCTERNTAIGKHG